MVRKLIHFFKYNNAFTLAILFVFLSTGTIFAANEDLREVVIASEERLVAVDNTLIRTIDLDTYEPLVEILAVTEDEVSFFVTYRINNIEIVDGVWSEVSNQEELVVAKDLLGERDLGLYVAEELQEVSRAHIAYLREVQEIEQGIGETDRTLRTEYSGLVGRVLDADMAAFAGYVPVIAPEKKPLREQVADENKLADAVIEKQVTEKSEPKEPEPVDQIDDDEPTEEESTEEVVDDEAEEEVDADDTPPVEEVATSSPETSTTTEETATSSVDTVSPTITLVGEALTTLTVGEVYTEAGASATDDVDGDVTSAINISGTVDTTTAGIYEVLYSVSDAAGNEGSVTRTVTVESAADTTPPVITLNGGDITLSVNDTYSEAGATATDDVDGDVTTAITISGSVDTSASSTYEVLYSVSDAAGNEASVTRTVTVE